ncbi:unnamed protein product [Coffea canephora]|uniref:Protein kinase domain-containing protein n=1 Tax=Coffea canephora TaxID=49390 RepID=A0A068V9I3_COFCA|nr:unnamed protein product [Coffea canephora]
MRTKGYLSISSCPWDHWKIIFMASFQALLFIILSIVCGLVVACSERKYYSDLPPNKEPLDWNTRIKIAADVAKGLEYLHDKANPSAIYRDFKSSNIFLDERFVPKLSDFRLAKLGLAGDKLHVSTRVMGTYGYCALECAMTGQLTVKFDVYSFGVVFLELIIGQPNLYTITSSINQFLQYDWISFVSFYQFYTSRSKHSLVGAFLYTICSQLHSLVI